MLSAGPWPSHGMSVSRKQSAARELWGCQFICKELPFQNGGIFLSQLLFALP